MDALDENKEKVVCLVPVESKASAEKHVSFKVKRYITVHLWPPGKERVSTLYSIPDYFQFVDNKREQEREEAEMKAC